MGLGKLIAEVFRNFNRLRKEIETREEGHANFNGMLLHQTQFYRDFKVHGFLKGQAYISVNIEHI